MQDSAFSEAIVRWIKGSFATKNIGLEFSAQSSLASEYQMLEGNKADVPTEESLKEISKKYCQTPCSFAESFHFASWIQDIKFGYKNTLWQESRVLYLYQWPLNLKCPCLLVFALYTVAQQLHIESSRRSVNLNFWRSLSEGNLMQPTIRMKVLQDKYDFLNERMCLQKLIQIT